MHASRPRVTGTPMAPIKMELLVTTIVGTITIVVTIKAGVEVKASLPVGEVNSQTRVGLMSREMTQCGHTAGILTLPVVALLRIAQRNTPVVREWVGA